MPAVAIAGAVTCKLKGVTLTVALPVTTLFAVSVAVIVWVPLLPIVTSLAKV